MFRLYLNRLMLQAGACSCPGRNEGDEQHVPFLPFSTSVLCPPSSPVFRSELILSSLRWFLLQQQRVRNSPSARQRSYSLSPHERNVSLLL